MSARSHLCCLTALLIIPVITGACQSESAATSEATVRNRTASGIYVVTARHEATGHTATARAVLVK